MDGMTNIEFIEHRITITRRERRRKVDWQTVNLEPAWQFKCSCGWQTGWVRNGSKGLRRSTLHALDGQLSFSTAL